MGDAPAGGGYLPLRCKQSGRLTPAKATLTKTSPFCGVGMAQLLGLNTSGPPPVPWSTNFMVDGSVMEVL